MYLGADFLPAYDFSLSLDSIAPGTSAAVADSQAPGESWIDALGRILPGLVMADSQRRLLNVQMDRARQGLPPLDASQVGLGVSVGLSDSTRNLLIVGGLAAAGLVAYSLSRR
jgi:hypothetical protein